MLNRRKKIGIAIGAGVAAAIALIVIVVVSTNKKGDPDNDGKDDGKDDKDDIGPLDGPWDNVSCDRQSARSWLGLDPRHEYNYFSLGCMIRSNLGGIIENFFKPCCSILF